MHIKNSFVLFVVTFALGWLYGAPAWGHVHSCGCRHLHLTDEDSTLPWAYVLCDPENGKCTYKGQTGRCETVAVSLGLTATAACKCIVDKPGKGGQLRFLSVGSVNIPGVTDFQIVIGAPENQAKVYFSDEMAPLCGKDINLPAPAGNFTISMTVNPYDANLIQWDINDINVTVPEFSFCGQLTGLNIVTLDSNEPHWGELNLLTGELHGSYSVLMYNDLYYSTPIREEMEVAGFLNVGSGELLLGYIGYLDIPRCRDFIEPVGDLDENCKVNLFDFVLYATHWLDDYSLLPTN
jgi:hypothetical protein